MSFSIFSFFQSFQHGSRLVDGGDCLQLAKFTVGSQTSLVALAGGGGPGATSLQAGLNEVTTVVSNNDSAVLPPAIAGLVCRVANSGASTLAIFPAQTNPQNAASAGDQIIPYNSVTPGTAASGSVTIATVRATEFWAVRSGVWKQVLLS